MYLCGSLLLSSREDTNTRSSAYRYLHERREGSTWLKHATKRAIILLFALKPYTNLKGHRKVHKKETQINFNLICTVYIPVKKHFNYIYIMCNVYCTWAAHSRIAWRTVANVRGNTHSIVLTRGVAHSWKGREANKDKWRNWNKSIFRFLKSP